MVSRKTKGFQISKKANATKAKVFGLLIPWETRIDRQEEIKYSMDNIMKGRTGKEGKTEESGRHGEDHWKPL